jgi:hypothetical protein
MGPARSGTAYEERTMSHHEGKAKGGAMKDMGAMKAGAGAKKATAKTTKKK